VREAVSIFQKKYQPKFEFQVARSMHTKCSMKIRMNPEIWGTAYALYTGAPIYHEPDGFEI
jgi:hypothetical protein